LCGQVLSVIAQQILTIQQAVVAGKARFDFMVPSARASARARPTPTVVECAVAGSHALA
jgi:hypothetical protein